jgi:choline dehydrogenase-like flavoprotein
VNDPNLTNDRFIYHHPDALNSSVKEWHENKTGVMASDQDGCAALARIDKTIQDPVWEAAKSAKQHANASDCDPTGQLPNQSHVELFTSQLFVGAPHFLNTG